MARKKKHPAHVNHERWLVSYADFITLLFAFFTTLYSIATVDQQKAGKLQFSMRTAFNIEFFPSAEGIAGMPSLVNGVVRPIKELWQNVTGFVGAGAGTKPNKRERYSRLTEILNELARDARLRERVRLHEEKRGMVMSLAETGFFPSGSAEMPAAALGALDAVAAGLAEHGTGLELVIEGHTDNVPIHSARFASNWHLSTARATFVVARLIEQHHMDATLLSASGYGEHHPVASNDTAEGRGRNRRVDIVIRRPEVEPPLPPPEEPADWVASLWTRMNDVAADSGATSTSSAHLGAGGLAAEGSGGVGGHPDAGERTADDAGATSDAHGAATHHAAEDAASHGTAPEDAAQGASPDAAAPAPSSDARAGGTD